jgi:hypothetical protein
MKFTIRNFFMAVVCAVLFSGCATFQSSGPVGAFVKPTDVAMLNTFRYDHTLVSGMVSMYSPQELVMKELSQQVLTDTFQQRSYTLDSSQPDFYIVAKWRKEVNMSAAEPIRFSLIVELYDASNHTLFWSAQLPYVFTAIEWSEQRVSDTLRLAVQNFPDHEGSHSTTPAGL